MNVTVSGVAYGVRSEADILALVQAVRLLTTLAKAS
jgi:hypothetical protein